MRKPICLGCWPKWLKEQGKPYEDPPLEYTGEVDRCFLCGLGTRVGAWADDTGYQSITPRDKQFVTDGILMAMRWIEEELYNANGAQGIKECVSRRHQQYVAADAIASRKMAMIVGGGFWEWDDSEFREVFVPFEEDTE